MHRKTIANGNYYTKYVDVRTMLWERVIEPLKLGIYRPPYYMNIHLSNKTCNAKCIGCVRGSQKIYHETLREDVEAFKTRIQELLDLRSADGKYRIEEFHFDGDSSDPLMPRNMLCLVEGIKMIKAAGRNVEIITNGINLGNAQLLQVIHLVDRVTVSLNATTAAEHEFVSGTKTFNEIMTNIKRVSALISEGHYATRMNISHVLWNRRAKVAEFKIAAKTGAGEHLAPRRNTRDRRAKLIEDEYYYGDTFLGNIEAHAKELLALPGVDNYVFRFDMNEKSMQFIKNTRKKIEAIKAHMGLMARPRGRFNNRQFFDSGPSGIDDSGRMVIKPFTSQLEAQLLDHCVASMMWNTLLSDGSFTGCAHNASDYTMLEPISQKPFTLKDVEMLCARTCPSFIGLLNKMMDLDEGPKVFQGYMGKPSEFARLLIKPELTLGHFTDMVRAFDPYDKHFRSIYYDPLLFTTFMKEHNNASLQEGDVSVFYRGENEIAYRSRDGKILLDTYKNIVAMEAHIAANKIDNDEPKDMVLKYYAKDYNEVIIQPDEESDNACPGDKVSLKGGGQIDKAHVGQRNIQEKDFSEYVQKSIARSTRPKYCEKVRARKLLLKEGERLMGSSNGKKKKGLKVFPEYMHNGNDLLVSRAKYFSSHPIELFPISNKVIKALNDIYHKEFHYQEHLNFPESHISSYFLHHVAASLNTLMINLGHPVDVVRAEDLPSLSRHAFKSTILEYPFFLKKTGNTQLIQRSFYSWFYPNNEFTLHNLNYLYYMKCFMRQAPAFQEATHKLIGYKEELDAFLASRIAIGIDQQYAKGIPIPLTWSIFADNYLDYYTEDNSISLEDYRDD